MGTLTTLRSSSIHDDRWDLEEEDRAEDEANAQDDDDHSLNYDNIAPIKPVEDETRHTTLPMIWVGVLPGTLTGVVAHKSATEIIGLLERHGFAGVFERAGWCSHPIRVDTVVVSTQHSNDISTEDLRKEILEKIVKQASLRISVTSTPSITLVITTLHSTGMLTVQLLTDPTFRTVRYRRTPG